MRVAYADPPHRLAQPGYSGAGPNPDAPAQEADPGCASAAPRLIEELWEIVGLAECALDDDTPPASMDLAMREFFRHVEALRAGDHWLPTTRVRAADAPNSASVSRGAGGGQTR